MLYWRHPLKTRCADKYAVRDYVKEKGWGHILTQLYGVYNNSSEIDYNALPRQFVLKCTHGCGFNVICKDKGRLDVNETNRKLDKWMKKDISRVAGELHYREIVPRIICEEYLEEENGGGLVDYKVHCIGGKAHCTMVCTERESGSTKFDFYDRDWRKIPYSKSSMLANRNVPRLVTYDEMIRAAEQLAHDIPFVRVDFYSVNGKTVFSEMTFTPNGCIDPGLTDIAQKEMGQLINLPVKLV